MTTAQLRLPDQAAAPAGPLDLSMMFVVHRAFRRDLHNFARAAEGTPVDDREAWAALDSRWRSFAGALHHHHSVEDARMWPLLRERAEGVAGVVDLLDAMEAEHAQIDPLLESVGAGFARLALVADDDARAALAVRAAAAREQLLQHLAHEEIDALALAQQVLSPDEWEDLMAAFNQGLGVKELAFLAPWALHELPQAVVHDVFGKEYVLRLLTTAFFRRPFLRRETLAFRHV